MKPHYRPPLEILRVLAENFRVPTPVVSRLTPGEAGYLAGEVAIPGFGPVCSINGYAVSTGLSGGAHRYRLRRLDALMDAVPAPDDGETTDSDEAPSKLERVETGDPVPPGCDRILPVHAARITGSDTLEFESDALPPAGYGIERWEPRVLPVGTRLDARLVATLLATGIQEVETWPSLEVGVGCIGSELVDSTSMWDRGTHGVQEERVDTRVADLNGAWLDGAIQRLGHRTQALGTFTDDPEEVQRRLRRISQLGVKAVVLAGGLGDGFDDRVIETLQSGPFRIFFSGAQVLPGRRVVYAQGMGIDLLVVGGSPLDAAMAFDLFVAPCLLMARGAHDWDWSASGPVAAPDSLDRSHQSVCDEDGELLWSAGAIVHGAEHNLPRGDDPAVESALSKFRPGLPSQWGWWLRSPMGDPSRRERYYRIPCRS